MKYLLALFLVTLQVNGAAQTPQRAESSYVYGAGSLGCGKWIAAREQKDEIQTALFLQWISGWVVSYNYYGDNQKQKPIEIPDFESMKAFSDQFCRINPLKGVFAAAAELIDEAGGTRAKHRQGGKR